MHSSWQTGFCISIGSRVGPSRLCRAYSPRTDVRGPENLTRSDHHPYFQAARCLLQVATSAPPGRNPTRPRRLPGGTGRALASNPARRQAPWPSPRDFADFHANNHR
eukprot:scaffold262003_cov45-Prasinocladus_malaysianus.AAC.1